MENPGPVRCPPGRKTAGLLCSLASGLAFLLIGTNAVACDGQSYSFSIAVGASVSGGGLTVRLDKEKLFDKAPDKYYVSIKDSGEILADHALLRQYDTVNIQTKCGIVSIGADRRMFSNGLTLNWSYF